MDPLLHDVRQALRRFAAAPAFSLVAIVTFSVAVAATTAMFAVVDAVLLRPLPFPEPDGLQQLWRVQGNSRSQYLTPDSLSVWSQQTRLFSAVEPFRNRSLALLGSGEPQLVLACEVGGGLMQALGMPPRLGRGIQSQDAASDAAVLVLSDTLWRTQFAADPDVLGRSVRLDDRAYEVVGVMPPAFRFPRERQQLWIPLASRGSRPVHALVRLQADVTPQDVREALKAIVPALERNMPVPQGWQIDVRPLQGERANRSERTALLVLLAAVAFVFLIACANVSNLLHVQATGRDREFAVRAAVGASRLRLLRLLFAETAVLTLAGGSLGFVLALWAIDGLAAYTPREFTFLAVNPIVLDARSAAFAGLVTVFAGLLAGALPALRGSRVRADDALRAAARSATAAARQERLRRVVVIGQVAMTLMLLIGAALLVRTFAALTRVDPGFEPRNLVTLDISLPAWKYGSRAAQLQFFEEAAAQLRRIPGVAAVTVAGGKPPTGGGLSDGLRFEVEGVGVVLDDPLVLLSTAEIQADYFSVLRIPVLAGGTFTRSDGRDRPVVINEAMARRLWRGGNPVGTRIRFSPEGAWYSVAGVVGTIYQLDYDNPGAVLAAYFPADRGTRLTAQDTLIVRTTGAPQPLIPAMRRAIWSVDPDQPILKVATMDALYGEFLDVPRFQAILMGAFALGGLLIAAIGIYGVLACAIAQRTREFGIRMALGARPSDVRRMVLRQGAALVGTGMLVGSAGGLALSRAMGSLLVGVTPYDPLTYLVVLAALGGIALAACWVPARRATQVDPVIALRAE